MLYEVITLGSKIGNNYEANFDHAGIGLTARLADEGNAPSLLIGATGSVIGRVTFAQKDADGNVIGKNDEMKMFVITSYSIHYTKLYD